MAHLHSVYDTDMHFSIDETTRKIQSTSPLIEPLIQYDHDSERLTFEMPRYIDGHDMSLCNKVEVHYINVGTDGTKNKGVYVVDDFSVSPHDETVVICSWLISSNATQLAGYLFFLIRFACLTDDVIDYAWHTDIYRAIEVKDGMNNGEAVIAEFPDVLEAWKREVFADFDTELAKIEASRNAAMSDIAEAKATMLSEIEIAGDIVQNIGDSETAVMSQKATTEAIENIENKTANALKGTASGTAISIDDVSPIEHEMAVKVSSINVIPYPYYQTPSTLNGITFTDNGDGSITVNGTATASALFKLTNTTFNLNAGTYTISGGNSGVVVNARKNDTGWIDSKNGSTVTGTFAATDTFDYIGLYVVSGTTVDNVTIYPQLELGTTATEYKPYVPDLTAVKVKKCGKNLLDGTLRSTAKTEIGVTIQYLPDEDCYLLNGTASAAGTLYQLKHNMLLNDYVSLSTVYISGSVTIPSGYAVFYTLSSDSLDGTPSNWRDVRLSNSNDTKVSTTAKSYLSRTCFSVSAGVVFDNYKVKIQMEKGKTATEYAKCITKEYTPSADGKVSGVTSVYPTTTFISNTDGVLIDCEYNRDINKAFAELQQAIISLGGNI